MPYIHVMDVCDVVDGASVSGWTSAFTARYSMAAGTNEKMDAEKQSRNNCWKIYGHIYNIPI